MGRHFLAAAVMMLGALPALAQAPSATIYRDPGFRGPAVAVDRANPDLGLRFNVQSIRVNSGSWELCTERSFRGRCTIVDRTTADLRATYYGWTGVLQSMRPARPTPPPSGGGGESLRGMGAEFFPAPRQGNSRVLACRQGSATPSCAAESADRFCRSVGWVGSRSESMQTERGRIYLADVLCAQSGT